MGLVKGGVDSVMVADGGKSVDVWMELMGRAL